MAKHRATALAVYNERYGDIEGNREVFYDMEWQHVDEETGLPYYDYLPGLYYEGDLLHGYATIWNERNRILQLQPTAPPIVVTETCTLNRSGIHFARLHEYGIVTYIWDDGH
jgi:hypothetical protein